LRCARERRDSNGAYEVTTSTSDGEAEARRGQRAVYDHIAIEQKWRSRWAEDALYRTPSPGPDRPKYYCLDFFPYPSGYGLSVGHGRNYVPSDVIARYHRMRGRAVLHPMGWDAFGLPAENEAIKRGIHPRETTTQYAANYRRQMTLMGCSYDWEREINSSTPDFYRWTQWFFLLLYRRGLAYRAVGRQWWCPGCQTVLANEQVDADGTCWRGHTGVYKRDMEQWYLRITAYAEQLLDDLATLDWPEHIVTMQRNWIGRSEGVEFSMPIHDAAGENAGLQIDVFTTRPDTIPGVTFVAVAPEHPLVGQVIGCEAVPVERRAAVAAYREQAVRRSDIDRMQGDRTREGAFTGMYAVNPLNGERVPVYVADYVLMAYGSGAIMGVPAHDQRDFEFAVRQGIPVRVVVLPPAGETTEHAAYTGAGVMVDAAEWTGLPSKEAAARITAWLTGRSIGRASVQYRMRDWLISRQRYWGAPIPIVYCDRCGTLPVPEAELPVLLPAIERWLPGDDGRSPLAGLASFVETRCPQCGGPARRETDTMDGFACSSWYFLRFVSPDYPDGPFDPAALAQWGNADIYVGGAEHAVMHLLYARFWTKVMADAGIVPFREPFPVLRSQGTMHARDPLNGDLRRMSKSAGNVVTPDSVAESHGADALRVYLLFMAPFENNTVWDAEGINGARRFLERTWRLVHEVAGTRASGDGARSPGAAEEELSRAVSRTVRAVTEDIETLAFNTAVAALMKCLNTMSDYRAAHGITPALSRAVRDFVLGLAPFAPHIAEELWERLGEPYSVHGRQWPAHDSSAEADGEGITLVVQVDGRVRDRLTLAAGAAEDEVRVRALGSPAVQRALGGSTVARVVYVPGRLLNIVTG
jgi:leucyl-tRNA synthetase